MDAGRNGWLIPPDPELYTEDDCNSLDRQDSIGRLCFRSAAEYHLLEAARSTRDPGLLYDLGSAYNALRNYWFVSEAVIARHEAKLKAEPFRLLHRQLASFAEQFSSLAAARPERPCSAFKAQQLNRVLSPLRALLAEDAADCGGREPDAALSPASLPLVSGTEEHSYSDVLLVLRAYLDICADFASRHYDGRSPELPPVTKSFHPRIIRLLILDFCVDEPKTLRQIGDMLSYRDRKTVRKYVRPLLESGRLVRTVPDRPNSRNQKYLTARFD